MAAVQKEESGTAAPDEDATAPTRSSFSSGVAGTDSQRLSEQLLVASGRGIVELVGMLLERGGSTSYSRADGWTALMAASSAGHIAAAEALLTAGANAQATMAGDGFTALHEACANGHFEVVSLLLRHSADATHLARDGTSPIMLASLYGHENIASSLLDGTADPAQARQDGFTAMRAACGNGHLPMLKLMIANSVMTSEEATCCLDSACANGHVGVVQFLLERRAPPNSAAQGTGPLLKACMANHVEVASLLIRLNADVDGALAVAQRRSLPAVRRVLNRARLAAGPTLVTEDRDIDTLVNQIEGHRTRKPTRKTAQCGKQQQQQQHPQRRQQPQQQSSVAVDAQLHPTENACQQAAQDDDKRHSETQALKTSGVTSDRDPRLAGQLLTASSRGLSELVRLLLARRGDPHDARGSDGWTPLMAAASSGHTETVELLLAHGAPAEAASVDGYTPLLEACTNGHSEAASLLLRHRANPLRTVGDGTTALILSSLHGHLECASLLLESGSPEDARQLFEQSRTGDFDALRASCGNGHAAIAALLLKRHDWIKAAALPLALASACANGHVAVAQLLLDEGVPVNAECADGATALMKACITGHTEAAALLVSRGADVQKTLEAARLQNNLVGIRRNLSRAEQAARRMGGLPVVAQADDSRDLDELVRDIEGSPPPPPWAATGRANKHLGPAVRSVAMGQETLVTINASSTEVDMTPDESRDELQSSARRSQAAGVSAELPQLPESAIDAEMAEVLDRAGMATATGLLLQQGGAWWSFRAMGSACHSRGAFYTVEALPPYLVATGPSSSSSESSYSSAG
eukprot:CAMPEP_0172812834 /NCGR_PEP_ID=MMETSP1075-20121228/10283_1 /TAXON_ID=2916 /ORGANISM="Ceratium fusus, Strain PA161109" /LENGTH=813 /DNA_ID=CAMNT_0013652437 /DNA_START=30 /DNA_END=2474 /DNA_ORIENTATION=+